MRAQECVPGCRPLSTRRQAFGSKDARDRGTGDTMPHVLQRTLEPCVPPPQIFSCHPHDEPPNGLTHAWSRGRWRGYVHFRATNFRCHRRIVSGVTSVANSRSRLRLSRSPHTARRRRRSSSSCSRRRPSCALSTRFSSRRKAITSRCSRSSHPTNAASSICNGITPQLYVTA